MKAPKTLTGPAREFWRRHACRLADAGILTDADKEAFTLLCQLWQRAGEMAAEAAADPARNRQYLETVKAWQSLARQFGLLPLERQRAGMTVVPEELDEWGLGPARR